MSDFTFFPSGPMISAQQMNIWLTWFDDALMTMNGAGKSRDAGSAFEVL